MVLGGGLALARGALRPPVSTPSRAPETKAGKPEFAPIVAEVDAGFKRRWAEKGIRPAAPATELAVCGGCRWRSSGTIPSLEEIRRFEARPADGRIEGWLDEPAARPAKRRLPGRAVRPRFGRHRGRPVRQVPPPAVHDLAERCDRWKIGRMTSWSAT